MPLEIAVIEWCQKESETTDVSKEEDTNIGSQSPKHDKILSELIELVKKSNHSIAGVLRACSINVADGVAVIETPYKFHKDRLDDEKTKKLLESALIDMTGEKLNLEIRLKK